MSKSKCQVGPMGNLLWDIPGDSGCQVYWNGPGASLRLIMGNGQATSIESPGSDGNYYNSSTAWTAYEAFLARIPAFAKGE